MATASVTYSFTASTTAVSAQVNQDFTDLVTFLNNQVVQVDGSKAMTAPLSLPASDPVSANQAARKAYVDTKVLYKGGNASGGGITAQALVGTLPATGTQLWVQGGQVLATTDANGEVAVTMPTAFATGLASLSITSTDGSLHGTTNNPTWDRAVVTSVALGSFWVRFGAGSGSPRVSSTVAFSWLAIGI